MNGRDEQILVMASHLAAVLDGLASHDEILAACEALHQGLEGGALAYRERVLESLALAETERRLGLLEC